LPIFHETQSSSSTLDDAETLFTLGEGIFSGFFEDEPPKKPVPAPAATPVVVPEVPAPAPAVVPVAPAKNPEEPLSNEVIPVVVVTEAAAATSVVDEKVAEPVEAVAMPEKVEAVAEAANEVIPVVEGEIMEQAASEVVVSEVPAAVTPAVVATVPESTVAAVAATPVKATSAEEEGLIEGLVSTFIGDEAADDGKR
jgi:hypothetical protein